MLKIVLLVCALFVAVRVAEQTCPSFTGSYDPYSKDILPSNCTAVQNCTMARCTCLGQMYSSDTVSCDNQPGANPPGCDLAYYCAGEFFQCLVVSGVADSCGEWSTFMTDALKEFLLADQLTYNDTALFSACARASCLFLNETNSACLSEWQPMDTCFAAAVNESTQLTRAPLPPGAAPVPRGPGGTYTRDVIKIFAKIRFNGDFSSIFNEGNTSAKANALRNSLATTLGNFLKYTVNIVSLYEGSLIADFYAAVESGNTGLQDTIANNINQMSNGAGGSKWFQDLEDACKNQGGCPFGISSVIAQITARLFVRGSGGSGSGTREAACETRCIAFIVIGIVVTITIIIAALLIYKHRAETSRVVEPDKVSPGKEAPQNPLA
jgi:hypothetical protein